MEDLTKIISQEEDVLAQIMPQANIFVRRHLEQVKDWYPHVIVPWSKGKDYQEENNWSEEEYPLSDEVRSALLVNLLTEDNLPYYYHTISNHMSKFDALKEWSYRWTAEEAKHSIVIRDYLTVTRAIDPWKLEDMRMAQVSGGTVPEPPTPIETLAYVSMQELATRISHRNTGKLLEDPFGFKIMARVAQDENLHHLFYRDMFEACLEVNPSLAVRAISRQTRNFQMPGTGIPMFKEHAKKIADAGIYNFSLHYNQILVPLIEKRWNIESIEGLNEDGEKERELLVRYMSKLKKVIDRIG